MPARASQPVVAYRWTLQPARSRRRTRPSTDGVAGDVGPWPLGEDPPAPCELRAGALRAGRGVWLDHFPRAIGVDRGLPHVRGKVVLRQTDLLQVAPRFL